MSPHPGKKKRGTITVTIEVPRISVLMPWQHTDEDLAMALQLADLIIVGRWPYALNSLASAWLRRQVTAELLSRRGAK